MVRSFLEKQSQSFGLIRCAMFSDKSYIRFKQDGKWKCLVNVQGVPEHPEIAEMVFDFAAGPKLIKKNIVAFKNEKVKAYKSRGSCASPVATQSPSAATATTAKYDVGNTDLDSDDCNDVDSESRFSWDRLATILQQQPWTPKSGRSIRQLPACLAAFLIPYCPC